MTTTSVFVERRAGQRFAFNLPVSLRDVANSTEGLGFTQDLSSRGVFFFTDMSLAEGAEVELTLKMPSEITLGESMRVRARGQVLRVTKQADKSWKSNAVAAEGDGLADSGVSSDSAVAENRPPDTKIGVAVCLNGYEYLPETEDSSADYRRISALHSASEAERPAVSTVVPRAVPVLD